VYNYFIKAILTIEISNSHQPCCYLRNPFFKNLDRKQFNIELVQVAKIEDVFRKLFG